MNIKKIILLIIMSLVFVIFSTSQLFSCFAVVAGKNATKDGSVLFGHSELNGGKRFLNFRVIPRIKHKPGTLVKFYYGGTITELIETNSFIWSENFKSRGSDSYINEYGVACASDGTHTKEDSREELIRRGDIKNEGIGYMLRRIIAQRARTARQGVLIAGDLIKKFGYNFSGVTLTIADPNEAWILSMVMGKHWVAQRVPDDEVVIVSNVNLINEIDLKDKKNFLGSKDIIDYAIKRGWYNPKQGKPFNFQDAYSYPSRNKFYKKYRCDSRQWRGQCLVTEKYIQLPIKGNLPFSVKPAHKLCVEDIRNILSDHLEGTEFDKSNGYKLGSPHKLMTSADGMICNRANQEIAVFQLRNWMPPELGCIYWRTTAASCSSVLTPWYLGITNTPDIYHIPVDIEENLKVGFHFNPPEEIFEYNPKYAFWIFNSLESLVDLDYAKNINKVRPIWKDYEKKEYEMQSIVENAALNLFKKDKNLCKKFLTIYSNAIALNAVKIAKKLINDLRTDLYGP